MEGVPTTKAYFLASAVATVSAIVLLVIGLLNAELLLSEKGFFGMAFTLSLFAAITVQKNVRDSHAIGESGKASIEPRKADNEQEYSALEAEGSPKAKAV
jgi:hypothetical protein